MKICYKSLFKLFIDKGMKKTDLVKKADLMILQGHLRHCVKEACENNNPEEKIEEFNKVLEKLLSK